MPARCLNSMWSIVPEEHVVVNLRVKNIPHDLKVYVPKPGEGDGSGLVTYDAAPRPKLNRNAREFVPEAHKKSPYLKAPLEDPLQSIDNNDASLCISVDWCETYDAYTYNKIETEGYRWIGTDRNGYDMLLEYVRQVNDQERHMRNVTVPAARYPTYERRRGANGATACIEESSAVLYSVEEAAVYMRVCNRLATKQGWIKVLKDLLAASAVRFADSISAPPAMMILARRIDQKNVSACHAQRPWFGECEKILRTIGKHAATCARLHAASDASVHIEAITYMDAMSCDLVGSPDGSARIAAAESAKWCSSKADAYKKRKRPRKRYQIECNDETLTKTRE